MRVPRPTGEQTFIAIGIALVLIGAAQVVLITLALRQPAQVSGPQLTVCVREYMSVQGALDAYMANNNVDTVMPTEPFGTNDMTQPVPLYIKLPSKVQPSFIRYAKTSYYFAWDATGRIRQVYAGGNLAPAPTDCSNSGRHLSAGH